ncbi:MAG: hypothetical protein NVS3B25_33600 [Hymenobacter sp.]
MTTTETWIAAEDNDLTSVSNHRRLGYTPSESRPGEWISIDHRAMHRLLKAQQDGVLAQQYRLGAEALEMIFRGNVEKWKASMKARVANTPKFISQEAAAEQLRALNAAGNFRPFAYAILEA